MRRVSLRSGAARECLRAREVFTTCGAMAATDHAPSTTGQLPEDWAGRYRQDAQFPGIGYAVLSYATPIAWVRRDGQVVIPDVGYSITTTRHQTLCRAWLN